MVVEQELDKQVLGDEMKSTYHIAICDDETKILHDIYSKIKAVFEKQDIEADYFCTDDSKDMMEHIQENKVDVAFLDIDMPYFSGMDIAAFLNEKKPNTIIVFVTSQDALVYQTFAYRPFGFIRKTHIDKELNELAERIKKELSDRKQDIVFTRGQELTRVLIQDILYIESDGNYLNVYTNKDIIKVRETMTNIEKKLFAKGFIRCHKGYLVNASHVEKLKSTEIDLQLQDIRKTIPVGRSYEKDVRIKLMEFMRN